jgi:hypothetical protein
VGRRRGGWANGVVVEGRRIQENEENEDVLRSDEKGRGE